MSEESSTPWQQQDKKEEEEKEMELFGEEMDEEDRRAASKLACFEDIVEVVGSCGRWNVCLFLLTSSSTMLSALITMSYQFLGATPDHWCHVGFLKDANWTAQHILDFAIPLDNKTGQHDRCHMYHYNYTKAAQLGYDAAVIHPDDFTDGGVVRVVPCSVRDFNLTQYESTLVTEWDVVCERRVLYATTQAVNQFGFLVGAIVTPMLADKFGRRPVALCAVTLTLLQGLASCFSPSIDVFIALRWGSSATSISMYLCCFLIMMEWSASSTRSSFGSLFVMSWALGCIIVPGIAYLVRPWRYLQAALVLPNLIFLLACRMLPESPRWLLLQGRCQDVENILVRIAATNRHKAPSKSVLRAALTRISRQMRAEQERLGQDEVRGKSGRSFGRIVLADMQHVVSPYSTVKLASRMCLLLVLWFSASSAYYGLSLNATNISADPYLYNFLGGVTEVPSYLMLWLLVARAGRRPSLSGLSFLCALCIAVNASLMFAFAGVPVAAKICLSLLGKMAVASAFHLLYLFTAELFTTKHRSLAVCHGCLFARIGSMASPYINDLLGNTAVWGPSAVFSVMAFLSCFLSLLLPETRDQQLPEDDHDLGHVKEKEESAKPLNTDPLI